MDTAVLFADACAFMRNAAGESRDPIIRISAARATTNGKGMPNRNNAANDDAAIAIIVLFFKMRVAMRTSACTTKANTAALSV